MKHTRIIGWIVAKSKQEGIDALEKMLADMKLVDENDVDINMHIRKEELVEEEA